MPVIKAFHLQRQLYRANMFDAMSILSDLPPSITKETTGSRDRFAKTLFGYVAEQAEEDPMGCSLYTTPWNKHSFSTICHLLNRCDLFNMMYRRTRKSNHHSNQSAASSKSGEKAQGLIPSSVVAYVMPRCRASCGNRVEGKVNEG